MKKRPKNTLILTSEPFFGFMPNDVRDWLKEHTSDLDLATALALVNDKAGVLGHELDEFNDPWLLYAFDEWWEVEEEIYNRIIASMEQSNGRGETQYDLAQPGLYFQVKPFMERNGFQDGAGWWVKSDVKFEGPAVMLG